MALFFLHTVRSVLPRLWSRVLSGVTGSRGSAHGTQKERIQRSWSCRRGHVTTVALSYLLSFSSLSSPVLSLCYPVLCCSVSTYMIGEVESMKKNVVRSYGVDRERGTGLET